MRVLIAGGTGLIGTALAKGLRDDGNEVIVLTRAPEQSKGRVAAGVRLERWDGTSTAGWGPLVEEVDAIVNLAGEGVADGRWSAERKRRIRQSRVDAGRALVAAVAAAAAKPAVLVQSSAVGYYGPCADEILTEEAAAGSDFLAEVCVEWEASTAEVEAMDVRRPVIRTGVVLSGEGGAFPRMALPFRLFAGGPLGGGNQYFPWIHVDDEVAAIRFLLASETASGPYNLTAPDPLRNRDFVRLLGRTMRRPAFVPTPSFALKTIFGEMSTVLLDGQRAVPARLQEAGYEYLYSGVEDALRALL